MKQTLTTLITVTTLLFSCSALMADTGTYQILDYRVKLTPNPNGTVEIEYFQRWLVTSGGIPWVTVGMPNSSFTIVPRSNKRNAISVYEENTGGWSGVHVTLDKNYGPSQTFEVGFAIVQNCLFYDDGENYRFAFWPGWYNRAQTDLLHIEVCNSAGLDLIKVSPKPDRTENRSLIWECRDLRPGGKFKIFFSVPKTSMAGTISIGARYSDSADVPWLAIIIAVCFFAFFLFLIIYALLYRFKWSYGNGPQVNYGGRRGTSLLGGHGGTHCVCACACAGCACACACAGGGAAGCERKLSPQCPLCRQCNNKNNCAVWNWLK
jgi:hypothetical protein